MRRREFIMLLGGAAAWPIAARAQQVKPPVIGFMGESTPEGQRQWVSAFVQRLSERGWTEGRNIAIEYRWAEGRNERFAEIVAELVRLKVDVIVTQGTPAVLAAKQATSVIPVVFAIAGNPVANGLVASLAFALASCGGGGGSGGESNPPPPPPAPQAQAISFATAGPVTRPRRDATYTNVASGGAGTGAMTYQSSNTGVATVNGSGVVTFVTAGSTTITANKAADANFLAASANYTLTITAPPAPRPMAIRCCCTRWRWRRA